MCNLPENGQEAAVTLEDYRTLARARVPSAVFEYIDCGAGDELTQQANRRDLDRLGLVPRCMRDVSVPDLGLTVFGHEFRSPIGFSPLAFHRFVHPDGEVATAQAARILDVPLIISAWSSIPLETIAEESGNTNLWFQTYLFKDRAVTTELVQRAERAGYTAIVAPLGSPVMGKRDRVIRSRFQMPDGVGPANFTARGGGDFKNPIDAANLEIDPSATWRDLARLREATSLPIVVKGLMNPRDVPSALNVPVSAVVVSNHGGRQLDSTVSTISVLPEVVGAVDDQVPVFIDSGFRRGTDVLKALALGAAGAFMGRPVFWALAVGGRDGIVEATELLIDELTVAMQLAGCAGISELRSQGPDLLRR